jgi:hypothetical protein
MHSVRRARQGGYLDSPVPTSCGVIWIDLLALLKLTWKSKMSYQYLSKSASSTTGNRNVLPRRGRAGRS